MYRKLVVNVTEHEVRVAHLEDGTIVELFINRQDDSDISGNIYKGRVQRVLPGMQAAFVNIGLDQAAFLYVDDIVGDSEGEFRQLFLDEEAEEENGGSAGLSPSSIGQHTTPKGMGKIEELIVEGQDILVHVAKSPMGTKGARVTTHASLPGRFLVLMPHSDHIGVSRRIEDEAERNRLKGMVNDLRDDRFGYIVRTASEGVQLDKFEHEMQFLKKLWNSIQRRFERAPSPSLLHQELDVSLRAVRDLLTQEADKLIIDNRSGYQAIVEFLDTFMPAMKSSVELYEESEPIFDAFNLEGDISRALRKKVWLKSGGYIVIEPTEALVAVDVNTGRYVGKHNLEETILKTNLEAVKEIAYQIRLRDIGGIIIIDFIDMEKKTNQEKVFNALKEALRKDRSKTHVLPMSDLGLIQMTRKRIKKSLTNMLCEPCFYCEGEGHLISRKTICYTIYREILREIRSSLAEKFTLRVNPEIADILHGAESGLISSLENRTGKPIEIYPDSDYHLEQFEIFEVQNPLDRSQPL